MKVRLTVNVEIEVDVETEPKPNLPKLAYLVRDNLHEEIRLFDDRLIEGAEDYIGAKVTFDSITTGGVCAEVIPSGD